MDIVDRLLRDRPSFHSNGTQHWDALPGTLRAIRQLVRDGDRTLETGCGASTVIFAAQGAYHTALSPDADEHQRVRDYLQEIGVNTDRLTFVVGPSDLVLPKLCTERILDAAFIDGAHVFPFPAIDWHHAARALKVGGRLVIDDIPIPAVACVFRYIRSDASWRLDKILDDRAAVFTLVQAPVAEDWSLQPFNRRPDYGFAPFSARARLRLAAEAANLRQTAARRFPGLRQVWKRVLQADPSRQ
jgi:SAM-dependent methyltransferase